MGSKSFNTKSPASRLTMTRHNDVGFTNDGRLGLPGCRVVIKNTTCDGYRFSSRDKRRAQPFSIMCTHSQRARMQTNAPAVQIVEIVDSIKVNGK